MNDDIDRLVFPDLPDAAVVALNEFLEDFYTAFQNHYFIQLNRAYHAMARRPDDVQLPLPLDLTF